MSGPRTLYHISERVDADRILATGFGDQDVLEFGGSRGVRLYSWPRMGNPLVRVDPESGEATPIFEATPASVDGVPIEALPADVVQSPDWDPREWEREPFYGTVLYDNLGDTALVVTFPEGVSLSAYEVLVGVNLRNRRTGRTLITSRNERSGEWLVPIEVARIATVREQDSEDEGEEGGAR